MPQQWTGLFLNILYFATALGIRYWNSGSSSFWTDVSLVLITVAGGHALWTSLESRESQLLQKVTFGFIYGLSVSCWRAQMENSHQHQESSRASTLLSSLPFFPSKLAQLGLRRGTAQSSWRDYVRGPFILCETCVVCCSWRFYYHVKFCWERDCCLELILMTSHYFFFIWLLGFLDWVILSVMSSIYLAVLIAAVPSSQGPSN